MLDSTGVESLHVLATFKRSPNVPRLFRTCPSNGNKNDTTTTVFFFGIAFCFWPLALPQLRPVSLTFVYSLTFLAWRVCYTFCFALVALKNSTRTFAVLQSV